MRGEDLVEAKQRSEELLQTQLIDIETAKTMTELAELAAQLRMIERLRKQGR